MSVWPLDARMSSPSYRGTTPDIYGCQRCGGAWLDRQTLDAVIAEAHSQASNVDPRAVPRKTMAMAEVVIYRPCPRCGERMNRRNFGRYSGVVVDECSGCGTYFDAGELEGVLAFVRGGGLTLAERRKTEDARRELIHRRQMSPSAPSSTSMGLGAMSRQVTAQELDLLIGLLRWMGRWVRRIARRAAN